MPKLGPGCLLGFALFLAGCVPVQLVRFSQTESFTHCYTAWDENNETEEGLAQIIGLKNLKLLEKEYRDRSPSLAGENYHETFNRCSIEMDGDIAITVSVDPFNHDYYYVEGMGHYAAVRKNDSWTILDGYFSIVGSGPFRISDLQLNPIIPVKISQTLTLNLSPRSWRDFWSRDITPPQRAVLIDAYSRHFLTQFHGCEDSRTKGNRTDSDDSTEGDTDSGDNAVKSKKLCPSPKDSMDTTEEKMETTQCEVIEQIANIIASEPKCKEEVFTKISDQPCTIPDDILERSQKCLYILQDLVSTREGKLGEPPGESALGQKKTKYKNELSEIEKLKDNKNKLFELTVSFRIIQRYLLGFLDEFQVEDDSNDGQYSNQYTLERMDAAGVKFNDETYFLIHLAPLRPTRDINRVFTIDYSRGHELYQIDTSGEVVFQGCLFFSSGGPWKIIDLRNASMITPYRINKNIYNVNMLYSSKPDVRRPTPVTHFDTTRCELVAAHGVPR